MQQAIEKIEFEESGNFYAALDNIVKSSPARIQFNMEQPGPNSKLWKRLRACSNGKDIEKELKNLARGKESALSGAASGFASIPTIILIAWIATLATGLSSYAIYKGRKVRVRGSGNGIGGGVEIVVE